MFKNKWSRGLVTFGVKVFVVGIIGTQATILTPVVAQSPTEQNSGSQPRIIQSLIGYSPTDYQLDEETYNKYVLYTETIAAGLSYKDYKKLSKIAYCESSYNADAIGPDGHDGGIMQIRDIHTKKAKELGHDITTLEGNIRYAIYLYKTQGVKPWYSSYSCHKIKYY